MGLRAQAAADLGLIVEDAVGGFGWPITVTNPDGVIAALVGLSTDIGLTIDPQTGMAVADRKASVALKIASLTTAGLGMPRGVSDDESAPWLVAFADINGVAFTFKVSQAMPDRAIGLVVCTLEAFAAGVHTGVIQTNLGGGNVQNNPTGGVVEVD